MADDLLGRVAHAILDVVSDAQPDELIALTGRPHPPPGDGIAAVLADPTLSPAAASAALGYDVTGRHLALVLHPSAAVALRHLSGVKDLLYLPQDDTTAYAWISLTASSVHLDGIQGAAGDVGHGLPGFRSSHRQALAVAALDAGPRLVRYRDVAPLTFLARDPDAARVWTDSVLGPLAVDSEEALRLRSTLREYVACADNAAEAARKLYVHRNTVLYRVTRAFDLIPRPHPDRLSLALALAWLAGPG